LPVRHPLGALEDGLPGGGSGPIHEFSVAAPRKEIPIISNNGRQSQQMMRLSLGFVSSRAIYVAAKLGIADLIGDGAKTAQKLAQEADVDPDALYRIMRLLSGLNIFHQDHENRFSVTSLGDTLRENSAQSLRDHIIFTGEGSYRTMVNILQGVSTGESVYAETFGKPIFEHLQEDPDMANLFHAGLRSRSNIENAALLEAFDFTGAKKVVDIGGGSGSLISAILSKFEHLEGVLFDRPPAIEAARRDTEGQIPRYEMVAGDFFEEVPGNADTYILKLVLHDWSDEEAVKILETCRKAVRDDAKVLIIEGLVGPPNKLTNSNLTDLIMLVATGGHERTEEEFRAIIQRSGFEYRQAIPTSSSLFILDTVPS